MRPSQKIYELHALFRVSNLEIDNLMMKNNVVFMRLEKYLYYFRSVCPTI